MARTTKPLTNTEIANAKPKDKKYPLTDGGGLFLLVKPNGANFSQGYARDVKSLIEQILLPAFGKYPITQISAPMALKAFKPLQEKGTLETLKRAIRE